VLRNIHSVSGLVFMGILRLILWVLAAGVLSFILIVCQLCVGTGTLFAKIWTVLGRVRHANVYDCCALAICVCCPVITLLSVCKDVLEIL
jgi:hypothetical protein